VDPDSNKPSIQPLIHFEFHIYVYVGFQSPVIRTRRNTSERPEDGQ
jgi:hypothetical protein